MSSHFEHDTMLANVRHALLQRRRNLIARRDIDEAESRHLLEERETDWNDHASNVTAAAGLDRLGDRERQQLAEVTAALERVDAGTWGRCLACGRQIAWPRLRVVPETSHCARCARGTGPS